MYGIRQAILDVLKGVGVQCSGGGFWTDEQGNLMENYVDEEPWQQEAQTESDIAWRDELGNLLGNYIGEEEEGTGERHCGTEQEEHENAVSAGHVWNTAQRGGA